MEEALAAYVKAVMGCDHIVCLQALEELDEPQRALVKPIVRRLYAEDDGFGPEWIDSALEGV